MANIWFGPHMGGSTLFGVMGEGWGMCRDNLRHKGLWFVLFLVHTPQKKRPTKVKKKKKKMPFITAGIFYTLFFYTPKN